MIWLAGADQGAEKKRSRRIMRERKRLGPEVLWYDTGPHLINFGTDLICWLVDPTGCGGHTAKQSSTSNKGQRTFSFFMLFVSFLLRFAFKLNSCLSLSVFARWAIWLDSLLCIFWLSTSTQHKVAMGLMVRRSIGETKRDGLISFWTTKKQRTVKLDFFIKITFLLLPLKFHSECVCFFNLLRSIDRIVNCK